MGAAFELDGVAEHFLALGGGDVGGGLDSSRSVVEVVEAFLAANDLVAGGFGEGADVEFGFA